MTTGAHLNGSVPISASFASASSDTTFDDLLTRFENEIYRFLLQLTWSRSEADELYQEMLTKAARAFGRLDGTVDHRAWIYKLATSTFLKSQGRARRDAVSDETWAIADPEVQTGQGPDLTREVAAELVRVPAKQRAAFVLRKYHDLTYEEIAACLRCNEAVARAEAQGALRALRDRVSAALAA